MSGFNHISTIGIGVAVGLLALFCLYFFFLRGKKPEKNKGSVIVEQKETPSLTDTEVFKAETAELHYCKCGTYFDSAKKLNSHIMGKRREMDKHGIFEVKPKIIINSKQKYRVLVNQYSAFGIEPKRVFSRINIPLGRVFWGDTSLPESGDTYWVKELKDGTFEPCDPLKEIPLDSRKSPNRAYKATHCDMAAAVWTFELSWKDMISDFMVIALVIGTIILGLVTIGG